MSLNLNGLDVKLHSATIPILVPEEEPLIKLANMLDWNNLANIAMEDLMNTPKHKSNIGRSLVLRTHFGLYILQNFLNQTDRGIINAVAYNPLYQMFCGSTCVQGWQLPHYSKIEEFRNRLTAKTHQDLGLEVLRIAKEAGYTKGEWMDVDSTVQKANISYPSDVSLMRKLSLKAQKAATLLGSTGEKIALNLKEISQKSKEYFFLAKNAAKEKKKALFAEIHQLVQKEITPVIQKITTLTEEQIHSCSQKTLNLFHTVAIKGSSLLKDISSFIQTGKIVTGKFLSLHAEQVRCICKGKLGVPYEFGRVYQLARLPSNFLLIDLPNTVFNSDKTALLKMLKLHQRLFGKKTLQSCGTDKGYYSKQNIASLIFNHVPEIGIQIPNNAKKKNIQPAAERKEFLQGRRAGIEPLIGHVKRRGLERSKMKSDNTTLTSAIRTVTGFNLVQMYRRLNVA